MSNSQCFLFHRWNGCRCTACGKRRDSNHDFVWDEDFTTAGFKYGFHKSFVEGCKLRCRICGTVKRGSFAEHDLKPSGDPCYDACTRCGFQKWHHDYVQPENACVLRCTHCGHEKAIQHRMRGRIVDGKCQQYCTVCGYVSEGHHWKQVHVYDVFLKQSGYKDGCICENCRAVNPAGHHTWTRITEGDWAEIAVCSSCGARDESQKIPLKKALERQRQYEEAMIEADSIHDTAAKGIR